MAKKGPGRPTLPPGKARSEIVRVRLRPAERKRLGADAKRNEAREADWARTLLLRALGMDDDE